MHLLTHALAGWCVGNCGAGSPRERALCIAVSLLPDLDGVTVLAGVQAFYDYHHVVAHNALVGVVAAGMMALASPERLRAFLVFVAVFHLHLLMDLLGSGEGWGIAYFWPFTRREFAASFGWAIDAWQNYAALALVVAWTGAIAYRWRRTPLEYVAQRFDAAALRLLPRS